MPELLEESKKLREIWGGFRPARVLITANNIGVFDHLTKPQSANTISKKLNTNKRATEILLDALTGLGLLRKHRDTYRNTKIASRFLVSGSPYYQGDILRHTDVLWKNWSGLDEVIKTGKPYRKWHNQEAYILGMHNLAILKARDVLKIIGLKGVKTALDLGGGPGTYSIEMAKRGVSVTLFDRPETIKIARKVIDKIPLYPPLPKGNMKTPTLKKGGEEGFKKNINFLQGDFLKDDFRKGYDLIFISQVLHAYSEKDIIHVLKKSKKVLNKGGRIVIQEFYISKDLAHPALSALFSVNMLVNTESGRCYSPDEIKSWFLKIGLKGIKKTCFDDSVLIEGKSL